jgi:uncharacterized protein involved in exopolysaccharide biosynthesis
MTEPNVGREPTNSEKGEVSLLALASVLLRWRWTIVAFGLVGGLLGLAMGLLSTRMYKSSATLVPQDAERPMSGLAEAASQFGVRLAPASDGSAWGTAMYVKIIRSRALLEPIALDTIVVAEEGAKRIALMDLLKIEAATPPRRLDRAIRVLGDMIAAAEDRRLGTVDISVTSKWPSVSLTLAQRLIERLNQFNIETRQSQAAAERQFVEQQAAEAERALRNAEDRLQSFLQRNRLMGSPQLEFERDRLTRNVSMQQTVYTSWLQSREQARIREVRDTPVITVLEAPQYPFLGEPRRSVRKAVIGGLLGGAIACLLAFVVDGLARARQAPSKDTREFFQLVTQATPRFFRGRGAGHRARVADHS